jgi:hypothetical protein
VGTVALAISFTFFLATVSYRLVEQPFRQNDWIERRTSWMRILGFCFFLMSGFLISNHFFANRENFSLSKVARGSTDWYVTSQMPYRNVGFRKCVVKLRDHSLKGGAHRIYSPICPTESNVFSKKIYVIGDSHAGMLAPLFDQLSAEEGIEISLFTAPGCTFYDLNSPMNSVFRPEKCLDFIRHVNQFVLNSSSPGDILLLPSLRLGRYGDHWANFGIKNMYEFMYGGEAISRRLAAVEDAKKWLIPFFDKQLHIIFTAPTPVFKSPPFRCSDWFNSGNSICIDKNEENRVDLEKLRAPVISQLQSIGKTYERFHVWDTFPILCPNDVCRTERDGRPLFFDGDHLSAYANLLIYPSFKATVLGLNK